MMKQLDRIIKKIGFLLIPAVMCGQAFAQAGQTINDFFNGDVLQEIRLDVHPKDWAAIQANPGSTTYYEADLHWRGLEVDSIGIRQRGGSTRNGIKPGMRVDFNRYEEGQTFLGLKSLGFDNNAQDASMMKERVVMAVFAKLGLPVPREVHARLFVNDEYYGLYTIIEPVDKAFLKRVFGEDDGYLYEYASPTNYHFEYLGSNVELYSPRFFDPKTHETDPNPAPIEAMIRTMNTASDAEFPAAMAPYLDLPLFMKHLAAEDFMAETDGLLAGMNNFFFYRFVNSVSRFIVKDKDLSFGGEPSNPNRPQTPLLANASKNVLIRRSMNVPAARDAYVQTIAAAGQLTGPGGWMESEILRIYAQVRAAALADTKQQCFDGSSVNACPQGAFDAEVAANLAFARERGTYVSTEIPEVSTERLFAVADRGGMSVTRSSNAGTVSGGYGIIQPDATSARPDGVAIFTYRQNGIVVTETSVISSTATQHGLIYAEIGNGVRTGIAIANPNTSPATVSFSFIGADGKSFGQGSVVIPATEQISRFVDEAPFSVLPITRAVLVFDSAMPVYVTALRGLINERSEFILSTLPVADTGSSGPLTIPHFADGGGWSTQTILLNPTPLGMQGSIQFIDQKTQATTTTLVYSIAPGSYYRFQTPGAGTTTQSGAIRIVPSNNTDAPEAFGIFSFRQNGVTVSEASIRAQSGSMSYRLYVENSNTIQTGIAIANPSDSPVTVNLEATTLAGTPSGLSASLTIPGRGQVAQFLFQIQGFEQISSTFQGVLRISTGTGSGITVAGLRGRYNERGDFLIATVPSVNENGPNTQIVLAFPHYVEGAGYTTQLVLFSGTSNAAPTGVIRLFDQAGHPINAQ